MQKTENVKKIYPIPPELTDVIPGFIARREQDIKDLQTAVEVKDFSQIERIAHKLKGNGSSFGFNKLTEIGIDLMAHSHQQNSSEIKKLIHDFEVEVKQIKAYTESYNLF